MRNHKTKIKHGCSFLDLKCLGFNKWVKEFKPIHLCWLFDRLNIPIPEYFIGGGTKAPVYASGNIDNATRTLGNTVNSPVTAWDKANDFIVAIALEAQSAASMVNTNCRLEWRNKLDGGTFAIFSGSGELQLGATDLVEGNSLDSGEAICTPVNGTTYVAGSPNGGIEKETGSTFTVGDGSTVNQWSEFQISVDASNALNSKEYEFRVYDVDNSAILGPSLATITMAAGATNITVTPENTPINVVVFDPTFKIDAIISPNVMEIVIEIIAISIATDMTVMPYAIETLVEVFDPTFKLDAIISPDVVDINVVVFDPEILTTGGVTVEPSLIEITVAIPDPIIFPVALSSPETIPLVIEIGEPDIRAFGNVYPASAEIVVAVHDPSIFTEAIINASLIETNIIIHDPSVILEALIEPDTIEIVTQLYTPIVEAAGIIIYPNPISITITVYAVGSIIIEPDVAHIIVDIKSPEVRYRVPPQIPPTIVDAKKMGDGRIVSAKKIRPIEFDVEVF